MIKLKASTLTMSIAVFIAILAATMSRQASAQVEDLTPPQLVEFSFSPTSVDVSGGPQSVTVTMRITDNLSGFSAGGYNFISPSGVHNGGNSVSGNNRISGDALDGIYRNTFSIAQFTEAGTWRVEFVALHDDVGNSRFSPTPDLVAGGFPINLQVTGGPDLASPQLVEFSFSPASIDVSGGPQSVTVTMRITDNLSGFSAGGYNFISPSGVHNGGNSVSGNNRISGDALDGIYQNTFTVPHFAEAGTWRVEFVALHDEVGNSRFSPTPDLVASGFLVHLEVLSNPSDTTPPALVELGFSPTSVDVSGGPQSVTVTMRITDNLSGFSAGAYNFTSPSGVHNGGNSVNGSHRISGDALDGIYQNTFTIPQFVETGTWRVEFVAMHDELGNSTFLLTTDLTARGFPINLSVTPNQQLTALGAADIWLGLKNSDDVGTKFDLLAEVYKNGLLIGSGQLNDAPGGSSGFNNAILRTIGLTLSSPQSVVSGDILSIKLSVRIAVGIPGHRSGTARLWFNEAFANSRFDATIGGVTNSYFLLNSFTLGTTVGAGPKKTIDVFVDRAVGGNPFKPFGTWSKTF